MSPRPRQLLPARPYYLITFYLLVCIINRVDCGRCSFTRNFGSGDSLSYTDVVDFNAKADAATTCSVSCDSGSVTQLYVRYGGNADILFHDGSDFSLSSCNVGVGFSSDDDEFELGYSLSVRSSYSNLRISCSCTDSGGGGGGGDGCFSESATVQVLDKGAVAMKDLQLGAKVLTGRNEYQPVYAFGHYLPDEESDFLQIHTTQSNNTLLEITGDHMIFVQDKGEEKAIRADAIKVGDILVAEEATTVTKIVKVKNMGMYMPLTPDGTLMVNGVKASAYVSIHDFGPSVLQNQAYYGIKSQDTILHWWLSPIRMLCMGVSSNFCRLPKDDPLTTPKSDRAIMEWMIHGRNLISFAEEQAFVVQVLVLGPPLFAIFASLMLAESIFGPAVAPSAIVMLIMVGLIWLRQKRRRRRDHHAKKLA